MFRNLLNKLFGPRKRSFRRTADQKRRAMTNGEILDRQADSTITAQHHCNHRKGGNATNYGKVNGDDWQYAFIKHTYPWGDTWVRCIRCGRTWKPADPDYDWAMRAPTNNRPSTSTQFRVDKATARELTKDSR